MSNFPAVSLFGRQSNFYVHDLNMQMGIFNYLLKTPDFELLEHCKCFLWSCDSRVFRLLTLEHH